jgi:hypothetical protein
MATQDPELLALMQRPGLKKRVSIALVEGNQKIAIDDETRTNARG